MSTRSSETPTGFADLDVPDLDDVLDPELARDVRGSIESGLAAGAVFGHEPNVEVIFRSEVAEAAHSISRGSRGALLRDFILKGPYPGGGAIPATDRDRYLSDADVSRVVRYIHGSAINRFKGVLAELLAIRPLVDLASRLRPEATVFVGDVLRTRQLRRSVWAKGADFHLISEESCLLQAVGEVKSYDETLADMLTQLDRHIQRAHLGIRARGGHTAPKIQPRSGASAAARIAVRPATWKLPRTFRFQTTESGRSLVVDRSSPPTDADSVQEVAAKTWLVTLRWSEEALAAAAYDLSFWYMAQVGRLAFEKLGVPREWAEMSPAEAGENAVRMCVHYAPLRAVLNPRRDLGRSTMLQNIYGFGYSLGGHFVDEIGRVESLFAKDLDEILANGGRTNKGARLTGLRESLTT